ncbi:cobalt-precorrin-6A reductase [Leptolyngbya sp. AN02str]|uniref:cobalt-precorrin-6A reductase n=1 Tax=Leptolyngbya sp. AN02str TaxID=3423363 RepID=UPI003D32201B
MEQRTRVLILGGTAEAAELAQRLEALSHVDVITSLAGVTSQPKPLPGTLIRGGFGGVDGLVDYLKAEAIALLIDATHPFAAQISHAAAAAAERCKIPRLMVVRPAWKPEAGDRWIEVPTIQAAVEAVSCLGRRVFLTIGRKELSRFADLTSCWCLMRLLESPLADRPMPLGTAVYDRPPYTVEGDRQLMVEHRIDTVLTKNSGGAATVSKLVAARELNLPMVMVQRPSLPDGVQVSDVERAVAWVQRLGESA